MQLPDRYEPAGPDIVSEEIDGEVVIVNLKNGNYYGLTQSATTIWAGIQEHAMVKQIRDRMARRYSGEAEAMNQDLEELICALEAEQLIRRLSGSQASASAAAPVAEKLLADEKEVYLSPVFERFTDMGDLLLLDPVHEVEDQKGWPHAKNND